MVSIYIPTYLPTYLPTHLPTCIHANLPTYLTTHLHAYMHIIYADVCVCVQNPYDYTPHGDDSNQIPQQLPKEVILGRPAISEADPHWSSDRPGGWSSRLRKSNFRLNLYAKQVCPARTFEAIQVGVWVQFVRQQTKSSCFQVHD